MKQKATTHRGNDVKDALPAYAVILAGGRGTRFWPRSRTRTPKQLLNIVGRKTMLQQTVERLAPVFPLSRFLVVTNEQQVAELRRQFPRLPAEHIIAEPAGRNTAAAIALAAMHLTQQFSGRSKDALMAVLPADHAIDQPGRYRRIVRAALTLAKRPGNLVVLGIPPTRAETGYGYIQRGDSAGRPNGVPAYEVLRFAEKPNKKKAQRFVASGRYYWNAGMFFWRVSTYLENLREYLPATYDALMRLAEKIGTPGYRKALRETYARLQDISVDFAIMEPASKARKVFVLPADVGWSDIGSWAAVYEVLARRSGQTVATGPVIEIDANGNFFWTPGKLVAAIGVRDLVVVDTPDALLICPRDRAQDVGQVVKRLEETKRRDLL